MGGAAEDVNRTAHSGLLLLADHAGRTTRMLEVCLGKDMIPVHGVWIGWPPSKDGFRLGRTMAEGYAKGTGRMGPGPQESIQNTYSWLPRPPQTRAAHFKRLYRK